MAAAPRLRMLPTENLTADEIRAIRAIMDGAFVGEEAFTDEDWEHALGATHFVLDLDGEIVSHAAVIGRRIEIGGRPIRSGYVEAVATKPAHQRRGYGTRVMRAANEHIRATYELGTLGTGTHAFYERLGWDTWRGPADARRPDGELIRTPDEEGFILVLRTPTSPPFELTEPISCDWRAGDLW